MRARLMTSKYNIGGRTYMCRLTEIKFYSVPALPRKNTLTSATVICLLYVDTYYCNVVMCTHVRKMPELATWCGARFEIRKIAKRNSIFDKRPRAGMAEKPKSISVLTVRGTTVLRFVRFQLRTGPPGYRECPGGLSLTISVGPPTSMPHIVALLTNYEQKKKAIRNF